VTVKMAAILWTVVIAVFILLLFAAKTMEVLISSNWYRRWFAKRQRFLAKLSKGLFDPFKPKLFLDLEEHLKTLNGDVVEVGIGSGENFDHYPDGTTLIAVDSNPHVEKFLRANVEKVGDRIHLKKFVAASAEDMSCNGKVGVEDNSVAAVVCTKLLCSLTEDQIKKTIQEVKRVLMPGGRFYFLEHVAGNPWTFQYFVQHFLSKSLIWPTVTGGCRCDRETLYWIEQGGFKMVNSEKISANLTTEIFSGCEADMFSLWTARIRMSIVNSILVGFAEKGCYTEEKKLL